MASPSFLLLETNSILSNSTTNAKAATTKTKRTVTMTPVSIHAELVSGKELVRDDDRNPQGGNNNNKNSNKQQQSKMTTTETDYDNDNNDDDDAKDLEFFDMDSASLWDAVASFSLLFLWFQRSTFFFLNNFLRWALVLVHFCLQLCLFRAAAASAAATTKHNDNNNNNNNNNHDNNANRYQQHGVGPLLDDSNHHRYHYQSEGVRKYFYLMQSLLFGTTGTHGFNLSTSSTIGSNGLSSCSPNNHHKQVSCSPNNHHKQVNNNNNGAWPPPALVGLAILTMLALIVHPDGMTWIVLRKIRDAFVAVLQSSTSCWAIMIRDYGVIGTVSFSVSASMTLVLIVAIAMHKAFLSNCCCGSSSGESVSGGGSSSAPNNKSNRRSNALTDNKKRRRRGKGGGGGGHRGRIKGGPNSNPTSTSSSSSSPSSPLLSYPPRLPKVEEIASDNGSAGAKVTYCSLFRSLLEMIFQEHEKDERDTTKSSQVPQGTTVELDSTKRKLDHHLYHHHHHQQEEEGASIMTSPSALESVVSEDYEAKGRTPVPSVCTVDTTAMSDDISCGSFSVRSIQQQQQQQQQQQPARQTSNPACNENVKGKGDASRGAKTNNKSNRGLKQQQQQQQQQKKTTAQVHPVATTTTTTTKNRADALKTAKAFKTPALVTEGTPMKFDQFKKYNGHQKRNSGGGGKGRAATTMPNPRESRAKNGRAGSKNQKNQPTAQTPPPAKSKIAIDSISSSSKPRASPEVKNTPTTVPNGSPLADAKGKGNMIQSNDLVNKNNNSSSNRLSPFSPSSISPSSKSLFSCEIGASGWSLPTLPPVVQPKTFESVKAPPSLSPALSYKTNPFVVPYNQMPTTEPGRSTTPVIEQVGLWNSVQQPSTPSTVASTVVSATDLVMKPSIMTTPNRPLRPPPGLPTPPGFSEAHLAQPILTNVSDLYTPLCPPENPTLIHASTPTFGTTNNNVGRSALSHTPWSSNAGLGGGCGSGVQSAFAFPNATTSSPLIGIQRNSVKENPFAEHPDDRIEAELQELGGRMIGSVLDF